MKQIEWEQLDYEERARILNGLPDAEGIDPKTRWDELPYWLRRHLAHFGGTR